MKLTQGCITRFDANRFEEVRVHRWYAHKIGRSYYVSTGTHKPDGTPTKMYMHVFLYPELKAPRDHIDQSPLNNCQGNLRSGHDGINQRNGRKRVTSKNRAQGVRQRRDGWEARWRDETGLQCSFFFASKYHGGDQTAFEKAKQHSADKRKEALDYVLAHGKTPTNPRPKRARLPQRYVTNKSGVPGIATYDGLWVATWRENKKPKYKNFRWDKHGGKKAALQKAAAYRTMKLAALSQP